jgi:hypothetical protein
MAQLVAAGVTLRDQINKRWPNRDKSSDGWIGDTAHQSRPSDHNPEADGFVHALDIDKDGIDADALADQLIALARSGKDGGRLKNIVFKGRVASGTYANRYWIWREDSDLGHYHHIHVSFNEAAETNGSVFALPVFDVRKWTVITRWKQTGVYARPDAKSKRVAVRKFLRPVSYVAIVRGADGKRWLKTSAGNYISASATRVG